MDYSSITHRADLEEHRLFSSCGTCGARPGKPCKNGKRHADRMDRGWRLHNKHLVERRHLLDALL